MTTKILDCTIRDGGHLNNWNFSIDCVKDIYNTAIKSGINFFAYPIFNIIKTLS